MKSVNDIRTELIETPSIAWPERYARWMITTGGMLPESEAACK